MKSIRIGTIKGRHVMPVNKYIFTKYVNPLDLHTINQIIAEKLDKVTEHVDLYVTGLTVVTTAVISYCVRRNLSITLWHFDRSTNSYYCQPIWTVEDREYRNRYEWFYVDTTEEVNDGANHY